MLHIKRLSPRMAETVLVSSSGTVPAVLQRVLSPDSGYLSYDCAGQCSGEAQGQPFVTLWSFRLLLLCPLHSSAPPKPPHPPTQMHLSLMQRAARVCFSQTWSTATENSLSLTAPSSGLHVTSHKTANGGTLLGQEAEGTDDPKPVL